jgi:uncharacterized SAM-binding protein YcdF (DUF218 family)
MDEKIKIQKMVMSENPHKSSVIVWLQGDRFDRAERALELLRSGISVYILITGNNKLIGKGVRFGENNVSIVDMEKWLIDKDVPSEYIIVDANALNTRQQAENTIDMAMREGWDSVTIVGSSHHQVRPFLTFLKRAREVGWDGNIFNQPAILSPSTIPSGRYKTSGEVLIDDLEKLKLYKDHVVSVQEGLSYLENRKI